MCQAAQVVALPDAAARLPAVNFVGVEWAAKYLRIANHRAGRRQLANIRFARTDAREFVEFFVPTRPCGETAPTIKNMLVFHHFHENQQIC